MSFSDVVVEPNTPPCLLIIEMAAAWFAGSVAAQQSSNSKHSYPISLAFLIVVWTQTSVVTPARIKLEIPLVLKTRSKFVPTKLPFPGLSMTTSVGNGATSGMISHPGSPFTKIRPQGPSDPMAAPICSERHSLLAGQSARSGLVGDFRKDIGTAKNLVSTRILNVFSISNIPFPRNELSNRTPIRTGALHECAWHGIPFLSCTWGRVELVRLELSSSWYHSPWNLRNLPWRKNQLACQ